jgi:cephalosporin hydroxylase
MAGGPRPSHPNQKGPLLDVAIGCSIDECAPGCTARSWCERLGIYQRFERTAGQDRRPVTEPDGVVQVAYLHNERVSHSWVESMRAMLEYDLAHGRIARKPLNLRCGAGMVAQTRNYGARLFLDKTDHEWLLYVDTDMGFAPDSAHRLLAVADPAERPVVGALCFAFMEAAYDGMGGWRRTIVPTMYKMGTDSKGAPSFCYYGDYPADTVTEVAATGGAFILIHRSALEKLRAEHGDHWFDQIYDHAGDIVGEDIAFCGRLLKAGIIPAVHTGVKTTHHKEVWLAEDDYEVQRAVTVEVDPTLPVHIDLAATLATLATDEHVHDGMLKLHADLDRYRQIIEATKPEVIVETGTHTGASARWFADHGLGVVTVDINHHSGDPEVAESGERVGGGWVDYIVGDATDPAVAAKVATLLAGRRCMVSLDSDHSAAHVAREIELYGPLVTPGCYLVVEDGIFGYTPPALRQRHFPAGLDGSPLDAIADKLNDNPQWSRDIAIERMSPTSHHPAGWWVRNG